MDTALLKENAKANLRKNHWRCVVVSFLMALGSGAAVSFSTTLPSGESSENATFYENFPGEFPGTVEEEFFPFLITFLAIFTVLLIGFTVLRYIVFSSFRCGGIRYYLKQRKNNPTDIQEVFEHLRDKTFLNIAKVVFIRDIKILLWTLLFIIPGIVKSYEYFAIDYILAVNPTISHKKAEELSKSIMDGRKADAFILGLSFIGWGILNMFTCGILGIVYTTPYIDATFVEFFSYAREMAIAEGKITPDEVPDYLPYEPAAQYQGFNNPQQGFAPQQDFTQEQPFTPPQTSVPRAPANESPINSSFKNPITENPDKE